MTFFQEVLLPEVNKGVANFEQLYSWERNDWVYGSHTQGFLSNSKLQTIVFHQFNRNQAKGIFSPDEEYGGKIIEISKPYSDFMKAYCVSLYKNNSPSASAVSDTQLLLKRIYVRMIMSGVEGHPANITSQHLQDAVDLLADSRTGKSANSNAANDYHAMQVIAEKLNHLNLSQTNLTIEKKRKGLSNHSTKASLKDKKKVKFAEDLDEDLDDRNLTIHTFLNVVALRSLVQTDGERIILNLVLLLMVTGFRHMEAAGLRYNSLRVIEIESETTRNLMEKRGLPTYFLGIMYVGEKGAGHRMHWVEPLAIEIVELIWVDTLVLTEKLRSHIEYVRNINFKSLLPKEIKFRNSESNHLVQLDGEQITLDEVVEYIYESHSESAQNKGASGLRDYATKKIKNAKLGIEPSSIVKYGKNQKHIKYRVVDIDKFIKNSLESDPAISNDLILRIKDSKTKVITNIPYEELLFIIPQGSGAISRSGSMKPVPEHIHHGLICKFLGYGDKSNRERSIFAKFNLIEEDGEYTVMYSHTPRHGKNTFYAIAGVSEHLQAMFMGRADIKQNEAYKHLAIEDKKLSTNLVAVTNIKSENQELTSLQSIKTNASIKLNTNLSLSNALSQSMHTYTTRSDRTSFIVESINKSDAMIFSEFDELFQLVEENEQKKIVEPHADLSPMNIGSCMRKLTTFQCPYNMKCQDGTPCPYFTLTGREDELDKISSLSAKIDSQITIINHMELSGKLTSDECDEILEDLNLRKTNIRFHLNQSEELDSEKTKINLIELDGMKKPKMLSTLFALEHRNKSRTKAPKRK